ncbi:MAG: sugar phosphate isomerase/epimerase [Armatimonadetes bacterium]|nr:sugar phosphate isomerase/epimerase [Armatimonadota bacterium]
MGRQPDWFQRDMDLAAARYRELLELGAEFGVDPAMEFLGFVSSVYLLEVAWSIVTLCDHPRATLVLDPFHLWRGGSGFGLVKHIPAERIAVCHFNDAPASGPPRFEQGDADRVYPGDGCLPLAKMLRELHDNGYRGALSLELFNPGYWATPPAENLRTGMAKTRAVLAAAGL